MPTIVKTNLETWKAVTQTPEVAVDEYQFSHQLVEEVVAHADTAQIAGH